jgi:hypothetical protein
MFIVGSASFSILSETASLWLVRSTGRCVRLSASESTGDPSPVNVTVPSVMCVVVSDNCSAHVRCSIGSVVTR